MRSIVFQLSTFYKPLKFSKFYCPIVSRPLTPFGRYVVYMTFKRAPVTLVNLQKVFYDFLKIQLAFGRQYVSKAEVFDVMAQVTQRA